MWRVEYHNFIALSFGFMWERSDIEGRGNCKSSRRAAASYNIQSSLLFPTTNNDKRTQHLHWRIDLTGSYEKRFLWLSLIFVLWHYPNFLHQYHRSSTNHGKHLAPKLQNPLKRDVSLFSLKNIHQRLCIFLWSIGLRGPRIRWSIRGGFSAPAALDSSSHNAIDGRKYLKFAAQVPNFLYLDLLLNYQTKFLPMHLGLWLHSFKRAPTQVEELLYLRVFQ